MPSQLAASDAAKPLTWHWSQDVASRLAMATSNCCELFDFDVNGHWLAPLNQELSSVDTKEYKKIKDLHELCERVKPLLDHRIRADGLHGPVLSAADLQWACMLGMPSKLVKYAKLALRVGYPPSALQEGSRKTGSLAASAWLQAIEFIREILEACLYHSAQSAICGTCKATVDQFSPSDHEEPGKGPVCVALLCLLT
jgi:hypothetical protein